MKNNNSFGLPYLGSKNAIAIDILRFLPAGRRFCDLCGGGGAVTHAALTSYKWDEVLYNEISPLVVRAFRMAMHGRFANEKRWISREDFMRFKTVDPYTAFCFSFGNNLIEYVYARENELWFKALHYARMFKNFSLFREWEIDTDGTAKDFKLHREEYLAKYKKHTGQCNEIKEFMHCNHLQALTRIQSLADALGPLESKLTITCDTYLNYQYRDGDIVYLDVPYQDTKCRSYSGFDSDEFYNWAKTRQYQVFFSSFADDSLPFYRVWEKNRIVGLDEQRYTKTECIYSNQPVEKPSLLPIQLTLF